MDFSNIKTPKFRLSFPELLTPKAFEGAEPKYSLTMLWNIAELKADPDQMAIFQVLQAAVTQCAEEKWGKGFAGYTKPFTDGATKTWGGYGEGTLYAKAKSKYQPGLIMQDGVTIITSAQDLYAGCYCRASVSLYASDFMGTKRVTFQLNNVQKWSDGEPFGGGVKAEKDFDAIAGADPVGQPVDTSLIDTAAGTIPAVNAPIATPTSAIDSLLS